MKIQTPSHRPVELSFGTSGLRGLIADMTDMECYINTFGFLSFLENQGQLKAGKLYIAGDLRSSTPKIMTAVSAAIRDFGLDVVNCGFIPTPALAYYAQLNASPCIMVTGSHIPDDRNGIKFYKADGEVLKADEELIKSAVLAVRERIYSSQSSLFDEAGTLISNVSISEVDPRAQSAYVNRYVGSFKGELVGKTVVVYQHSAVGRDIVVEVLEKIGANVIAVGRSEKFIPIDTENVTADDQAYFKDIAEQYPNCFAILSTDGDSDRPFVIDEKGIFHRGDDLGALVAVELGADFAAYPISSSDAVDSYLEKLEMPYEHTKIGSPYVIVAMEEAIKNGKKKAVGWEVNGGFLLGSDFVVNDTELTKLPTRDALFPMLYALKAAVDAQKSVSDTFARLPKRYTQAGLIDNFLSETYAQIRERFSEDTEVNHKILSEFFNSSEGYGQLVTINSLDGLRLYFDNHEIAHIRGSGNAPQLRIYSVADSQERADEIVDAALDESGGILRRLEQYVTQKNRED